MSAIIVDTSGLVGLFDRRANEHKALLAFANQFSDWLFSAAILAEIDYMLRHRLGANAAEQFLVGLSSGAYLIEPYLPQDVRYTLDKTQKYSGLHLGLADCAVMALSERLHIPTILTLDNHFNIVKPTAFKHFALPLLD